ncbi:MAG: bifunctional diaminohydroxyphosphoribosylaminopyrimidine deaminase/5-amino-6-(5-phosphoribosylamino)uracil reductase RibD [bacterium]
MKKADAKETDRFFMGRALELAAKGRGSVSPNPLVGAVIVKNGKIIGEGYHKKIGEHHAEINALRNAKGSPGGATMYVNLEPCSHEGKTPPCAPAIVEAGISRVVVGMRDPNPLVSGRGLRFLRKSGVEVGTGVMAPECRRLNEAFIKYISRGEPFVILKGACSLDGKIAAAGGDSKWISSKESRRDAHRLRAEADAVLVGIGTVLNDNPRLTCRLPGKNKNPYRVVLDSRLRIKPNCNLVRQSAKDQKTIIATIKPVPSKKRSRLENLGCLVLELAEGPGGRPDIHDLLLKLFALDVSILLVEGGSEVNASFLKSGAVDKVILYVAPKIIGGATAPGLAGGEGIIKVADGQQLLIDNLSRSGPDIRLEAYPARKKKKR